VIYLFDYLLFGFVITFVYFSLNADEVKKMELNEAVGKFLIVWLIYPIVLVIEFIKFLIKYFIIEDK